MRSSLPWVVIALVAVPVAAESRIRVENTSDPSSRLTVAFASESRNAAKLKVGADGVAELVIDAPSPKMRLRGGTLQTDPMIDLIARRQDRQESAAPALYIVDSADTPAQFSPFDGPLVYDDWGGMYGAGAWGGGYYVGAGGVRSFGPGDGHSHGGSRGGAQPSRPSSNGGSFHARGVIARPAR
ncbi:MAG: hypothetical protein WC538_12525 [Thermoanaerobaculia bacterium]|jgi:hypothetical protein